MMAASRRCLVVMNQTAGGDELVRALEDRLASGPCWFHLVVFLPRLPDFYESALVAYAGDRLDDRQAQSASREVLEGHLGRFRHAGARGHGEVGGLDPLKRIIALTRPQQFDEVILCTPPGGLSRVAGRDLPRRVERNCRLPATRIYPPWTAPGPWHRGGLEPDGQPAGRPNGLPDAAHRVDPEGCR
jgi:hypothetical protein